MAEDSNPNQEALDALESLVSLGLRSESQEALNPLAAAIQKRLPGLDDPGIPIALTVKVDVDGNSQVRYLGEPDWAIHMLRSIADQIEQEVIVG